MTLKELRDGGYLQEANRRFFHPLGLALAVRYGDGQNPATDEPAGVEVRDYRADPEGVYMPPARDPLEASRRLEFAGKIDHEIEQKREKRTELLGGVVQGEESLIQVAAKSPA
jgi:hypothetical protein